MNRTGKVLPLRMLTDAELDALTESLLDGLNSEDDELARRLNEKRLIREDRLTERWARRTEKVQVKSEPE